MTLQVIRVGERLEAGLTLWYTHFFRLLDLSSSAGGGQTLMEVGRHRNTKLPEVRIDGPHMPSLGRHALPRGSSVPGRDFGGVRKLGPDPRRRR